MTIYTIIVTYNAMRRNWIAKCLNSLRDSSLQTTPIVVDNCSTDNTVDFVRENYPEVVLFPQSVNLGFGQGNNLGIRYAMDNNADYILLLNQDAYLASNALEELVKMSDGKSMLSPLHLSGDGRKLDANCKWAITSNNNNMLLDDALIKKNVNPTYKIDGICAACWFLPISVVKRIGGFNKTFFHYGEDNNYIQRLKYHGVDIHLVTTTYMRHDRGEHGNMVAYNNKRVRRDIFVISCNINNSLRGVLTDFAKLLIKLYREEVPRNNYRFGGFTIELMYALFHLGTIKHSRKIDKRIGTNWL